MPLDTPRNPFRSDRYDVLTLNIPGPGAGNPVLWPVPANQVIDVVGVCFMVMTSGALVNRRFYVAVQTPGPMEVPISMSDVTQIANLNWFYCFSPGVPPLDASVDNYIIQSLPVPMEMKFGDSLSVNSVAIDPGDNIVTCFLRYRLWSED